MQELSDQWKILTEKEKEKWSKDFALEMKVYNIIYVNQAYRIKKNKFCENYGYYPAYLSKDDKKKL